MSAPEEKTRLNEPVFRAIHDDDPEIIEAHARASATIPEFLLRVRRGGKVQVMAKLRFKDPDLSDQLGEDRFFYLWLSEVVYHPDEELFSGVFFEIPQGFEKWHQVGQRLGFEPEDMFDWMVIDDGHLRGGFTIRVTRSRQKTEEEKVRYDEYIGVTSCEPIDD